MVIQGESADRKVEKLAALALLVGRPGQLPRETGEQLLKKVRHREGNGNPPPDCSLESSTDRPYVPWGRKTLEKSNIEIPWDRLVPLLHIHPKDVKRVVWERRGQQFS